MLFSRRIKLFGLWTILTLTCAQAFPTSTEESPPKQARQEDEDEAATIAPVVFGTHVAQIITGALTGNIDSIIKGSFGFIQQPEVNQLSHNTWETLKGNPTVRPAFAPEVTTVAAPPAPAVTEPPGPKPEEAAAESFPSSGSGSVVFTPTVRATQPTAATLAPLQVIESLAGGTETDVEAEQSTSASASTASSTKDVDDEDEDNESGEELKESSTTAQVANAIVPETSTSASEVVTQAAATEDTDQDSESTTGGTSGGDSDAETTTEEDDQDQLDNENSLYG